MIIKPKCKGFICTTAHPLGCYKNVEDMAAQATQIKGEMEKGPKNVLVIGASGGYGLASRIVSAFSYHARTVGVSFEKNSTKNRTATAGFYNNRAFDDLAEKNGIAYKTINGDAFSDGTKDETISACRNLLCNEKIDLIVYSLAAPKRTDPATKVTYSSVIKPIGTTYQNKTVDFHTGLVSDVAIEPAREEEIASTIKVMGGDDWNLWIQRLMEEKLLAKGCITVAYSYIGPELTHAVYKNGTIGKAKDDLLSQCDIIANKLKSLNGSAYVSVNKALVTQASSAIPVVPLYISLLYKVMKQKGTHEGCLEQIIRLFTDRLYSGRSGFADMSHRIRMDDYELEPEIQKEIDLLWPSISTNNVEDLTDIKGYRNEFFRLFGFERGDINYDEDITEF